MAAIPPAHRVIFFDAAGTLFHLPKGVGYHYSLVGQRLGLHLDAEAVDHAFSTTWKEMPVRPATGRPRVDDDKSWWRALVERVLDQCAPDTKPLDRETYFEVVYTHFAEAGVWELFPEVIDVLEKLCGRYRLAVISNFDDRLRVILEQLGLSRYFSSVVISSEVGADKPDPLIFQRALELSNVAADVALHVGDDPVRDWQGAAAAKISIFKLDRSRNSLRDLLPE
ncbi:MAG: HAD-IA family hydrolase [Chthoniobacterales bacterium]